MRSPTRNFRWCLLLLVLLLGGLPIAAEAGTTLQVLGMGRPDPATGIVPAPTPVTSYRWLIEEDATYRVQPGVPDPNTLSVSFHRSYMPVVAAGCVSPTAGQPGDPCQAPEMRDPSSVALDPARHYFVSVLPMTAGTFTNGGAPIAPGQASATVRVNQLHFPTAQITVYAFNDNAPINNAPDLPNEQGLAGFSVIIEDAGGRYGISGGTVSQDVFGNPLGTTYQTDPNTGQPVFGADGAPVVLALGDGSIETGPDGTVIIKWMPQGKYGILVNPPAGTDWVQTSTIEGTKVIDAWVKANEPPYFQEFGPPGPHVAFGFVRPMVDTSVLAYGPTVSGQVVNMHMTRPPDYTFYSGAPFEHTTAWIGLNLGPAGAGRGVYAQRANPDGTFSIPNVPPGSYQLVVWDDNLDLIFGFYSLTVNADGSCATPSGACNLGEIPVFQWFTRLEHEVFLDSNQNGFRDPGEPGIPEQVVNLRWRDGTVYQSFPTDGEGFVPFDEVFPFFAWQVAEVDYLRYKATGVTVTVDNGGEIPLDDPVRAPWTFGGKLNPQPQFCTPADVAGGTEASPGVPCTLGAPIINPNTGDNYTRTETGPVLTQAFQGFIGQTSVMQWGKAPYALGENGGISGIVYYASTRAEDDPALAVGDTWEPGIPRVQVNLYADVNMDGVVDDLDGDGAVTLADVDNHPFGNFPGAEDVDRNGNGVFDQGDAIQVVTTDSWDDNLPAACQGDVFLFKGLYAKDCYDGLRSFNQVRPGVFDGGYAFNGIPAGVYIVEAVPPPGYVLVKEEDKNVDFGDSYNPTTPATPGAPSLPPGPPPASLPVKHYPVGVAACVGDPHWVPAELELFPGVPVNPPHAASWQPLCDRRQVALRDGQNAAANFFLFTKAPIAGHILGFILDDTANEFDPGAPNFGEKYAPPFLPISIRDWTGREINRVYSDEYGVYNALVPSTYTANVPNPSGYSPNMITVCLNSPMKPNPVTGELEADPFFNRQYSQFCYTFQYMPGTTTYLDTPVIPLAAFAGPGQFPLDADLPSGTPTIHSVSNNAAQGPWIQNNPDPLHPNRVVTIVSVGQVDVPNPAYAGVGDPNSPPKTILRDHGFGTVPGSVTVGGVPLTVTSWTDAQVVARVPLGVETSQLNLTRGDNGKSTIMGVTLSVGGGAPLVVGPTDSIQAAIDAAAPGRTITVQGHHEELLVMWKPVRLQGWGAGSTVLNAVKAPAEKLDQWRIKVRNLVNSNAVDLLPAQENGLPVVFEPVLLFEEEGSGILVLARDRNVNQGGFGRQQGRPNGRIDGFTITGADHAGGIVVNGYARWLQISNNRILNNSGVYGGGIRVGHATLTTLAPNGNPVYQDAVNPNITIHHNHVATNGGLSGAGGGISLYTGSDNYEVTDNYIVGNFTTGQGGGIGHLGHSDNGTIARNTIVLNESFNQGLTVNGGGLFIGGAAPLVLGGLSEGSGTVTVEGNLIQTNYAAAGNGGGIALSRVNGQDVTRARNNPSNWFQVRLFDNLVVNNVAGLAGGGISLADVARSRIMHNTIAHNDSTATAGEAFAPGSPNLSTPQPAGLVSHAHSPELTAAFGNNSSVDPFRYFANPRLVNNIVWENRTYFFTYDPVADPPTYVLQQDPRLYWDLEVKGSPDVLNPENSILTGLNPDPLFVREYFNVGRGNTVLQPEITTAAQVVPAFDEGGNFIKVRFGPLTLERVDPLTGEPLGIPYGDYHIRAGSSALGAGQNLIGEFPDLATDFDGESRPSPIGTLPDIGADERP